MTNILMNCMHPAITKHHGVLPLGVEGQTIFLLLQHPLHKPSHDPLDHRIDQVRKIAGAMARHTGQDFEEAQRHLWQSLSINLMKGNAQLLANRIPEEETF